MPTVALGVANGRIEDLRPRSSWTGAPDGSRASASSVIGAMESAISGSAALAASRGYARRMPRSWRWKESTELENRRSESLRSIIGVRATTQMTASTAMTTRLTLLGPSSHCRKR